MARWEPGTAERLRQTAFELFDSQGFDQTTTEEIARAAGLTQRTFFRHFADKREVLFAGSSELERLMVGALEEAPASAAPLDADAAALAASAEALGHNQPLSRRRAAIIADHADLRERELIKLDALTTALAGGLGRRGVGDLEARLAAEAGVAVFRTAFERWVLPSEDRGLGELLEEALGTLRQVTARPT